jgi:hypothetical protein
MSHPGSVGKRVILFLHAGLWSILWVLAAGWLIAYLVGTLGDPSGKKAVASTTKAFDGMAALTEKKVVRYLGAWEFEEPHLPGHFHHVGRWYQADQRNFCIECHGAMPHSRSPQVRAFLNMHNLFIACQVCHAREEQGVKPSRFGWLSLSTGQLGPNPEMTQGAWGEYGAKIIPLRGTDQDPKPLILAEEEAFAEAFRQGFEKLNDSQKAKGNKFIHRRCTETTVRCYDCHNAQAPFIPYGALGYSSDRAAFLVSAEVADLVARYEPFYLPSLLKTNGPGGPRTEKEKVE